MTFCSAASRMAQLLMTSLLQSFVNLRRGLPGKVPGDLYAVLTIALPPSGSEPEREAWRGLSRAFTAYNPRAALEARDHG